MQLSVCLFSGPRLSFFVCAAAEDVGEEVAALVGGLVAAFVVPCVQQRVGDDVLLLDCDLVDDHVGQAPVAEAIGSRAFGLVGLLHVRAFRFACAQERFFFGFADKRSIFRFFFWRERGQLLVLFDRFVGRVAVEAAVLARVSLALVGIRSRPLTWRNSWRAGYALVCIRPCFLAAIISFVPIRMGCGRSTRTSRFCGTGGG